jgi:hypothetical protein
MRRWGGMLLIAVVALVVSPDTAWAWTPGTHVFLGEAVLRNLTLLPAGVAALLQHYPYDFLYGSIAADTSMAKKYAAAGRHCHAWHVGMEIRDLARSDSLRAFGIGYLSHLAADVVAHNYFVPFQLAGTASTTAIGHSYWETRFETLLPPSAAHRAHELLLLDHGRADEHLDRILSPTLFSTGTNRRLFRGMVRAADNENWQRVFQLLLERSRWDLDATSVEAHLVRSFDFIVDFLRRDEGAEPYAMDPAGDAPLREAKRVRRQAVHDGGAEGARDAALRAFGLPHTTLDYAQQLDVPLYPVMRAASS